MDAAEGVRGSDKDAALLLDDFPVRFGKFLRIRLTHAGDMGNHDYFISLKNIHRFDSSVADS